MDYIFKTEKIALRKLENTQFDLELIYKWRSKPEIKRDFGDLSDGVTTQNVLRKNSERLDTSKSLWETQKRLAVPCIIEFQDKPIGYLQFYDVDFEEYKIPREKFQDFINESDRTMATDLYIGEVNLQGQGLGTKIMKQLIQTLFEKYSADVILIDPKIHNKRAIKCYHNAGFKDLFVEPKREKGHNNLIMGIRKNEGE